MIRGFILYDRRHHRPSIRYGSIQIQICQTNRENVWNEIVSVSNCRPSTRNPSLYPSILRLFSAQSGWNETENGVKVIKCDKWCVQFLALNSCRQWNWHTTQWPVYLFICVCVRLWINRAPSCNYVLTGTIQTYRKFHGWRKQSFSLRWLAPSTTYPPARWKRICREETVCGKHQDNIQLIGEHDNDDADDNGIPDSEFAVKHP